MRYKRLGEDDASNALRILPVFKIRYEDETNNIHVPCARGGRRVRLDGLQGEVETEPRHSHGDGDERRHAFEHARCRAGRRHAGVQAGRRQLQPRHRDAWGLRAGEPPERPGRHSARHNSDRHAAPGALLHARQRVDGAAHGARGSEKLKVKSEESNSHEGFVTIL